MAEAVLDQLTAQNMYDLRGVVAVITGGGTGLGLMMATTLVANGADVYIIGPKQADLDRVAKTFNDAAAKTPGRGRIYGIEGDIRSKSEATRLASEVDARAGHVTMLFNNAGITVGRFREPEADTAAAFVRAYFDTVSQDDFADSLATNAIGPYWMTFAFLPLLEKWKQGTSTAARRFVPQVIMTASMNGWTKDARTGGSAFPYLFSKSAIGHATASLAHELLPLGIRVNAIAPGLFPSEITGPGTSDALGNARVTVDVDFRIPAAEEPGGSLGTNKDIGSVALMLAANRFMNGSIVLIDGGTMLLHPNSF